MIDILNIVQTNSQVGDIAGNPHYKKNYGIYTTSSKKHRNLKQNLYCYPLQMSPCLSMSFADIKYFNILIWFEFFCLSIQESEHYFVKVTYNDIL